MAQPSKNKGFLSSAYDRKNGLDTKQLYRDWANTYDEEVAGENDYAQPRRCAEALARALDNRADPVLDIGCGTGLSGKALGETGFASIDGCDFSKEMLAIADNKNIYNRLFVADLNAPPINAPSGFYTAATAVGVFSFDHIDPDSLDEILRILKPGAPLIIGLNEKFYNKGSLENKFAELEQNTKASIQSRELGEHLPGMDVKGWVIVLRKTS